MFCSLENLPLIILGTLVFTFLTVLIIAFIVILWKIFKLTV